MTTLPDATAAPKMLEHRGEEYRLRPLDYDGIAEIERWLQSEHIAITERNLPQNGKISPELRERLLVEAYARASRIHLHHPDADALLCTAEGLSRLIWCSMRRDRPGITLEEVRKVLSDPDTMLPDRETIDRFAIAFRELHHRHKESSSPKKARRRRRKKDRLQKKSQ
jgi:hypothetical protein